MNFVSVKCGVKDMLFLIDTGASISVIFSENVQENQLVDLTKKVSIVGIAGSTNSIGSTNINFLLGNRKLSHEFLVIKRDNSDMQGVLGSDFLKKNFVTINYETFLFSFWNNNEKISVPMRSKSQCFVSIPARSEVIKYVSNVSMDECVVFPEELCEGVFIAGMVVKSENGKIPVRFLNVNDREVRLKNYKPILDHVSGYEVYNFETTSKLSVERIDKVLDLINTSTLNKEEKLSIDKICAKYSDLFRLEGDPLTITNLYKQKFQLKQDASTVYVKPYRLPQAQKAELQNQVKRMLKDGIIEESKSEWSSPLLIVPKKSDKNGVRKWRVVIDYRLLNKQIKDDKFPLPCITDILDSLAGAFYFSHLDLSEGYYQLELHESSRPFTAFTTNEGQYQMKRLPMGLKISPSAFSRLMTVALAGLNYETCFVYLDDIIVFGNSLQNHNLNLVRVFERLRKVNVKLNPQKCDFLKKEILYLGHVISAEGVSPDPSKTKAISQYPCPTSSDEAKRFVAFANYYRKFIDNFAKVAKPLNELARKGKVFEWTTQCQKSFETLKEALMHPPILEYPDFSENNRFIIKTDASGYAIGAVLCNGNDRPVAFASRVLNKAEQNYCTVEKELLAIVWSVKHFRPYVYGRKFTIFTDHRPLIYLFNMTNPSSRLIKFRLVLEEYDFTVEYIKGSHNVTADALSRIRIESSELKKPDVTKNTMQNVNAMTRAQAKTQGVSNQQKGSATNRIDHPGLVELLKQPIESVEMRPINNEEFIQRKSRNCVYTDILFIYDETSHVFYFNRDIRSTTNLGGSLRNLSAICKKLNIEELCVIKNASHDNFIKILSRYREEMLREGIKISVVKDVKQVESKEVRQLILNDFHNLPTGGHAGTNRMFNNIRKYYFWSGMKKDVENFVRKCNECQKQKYSIQNSQKMTITTTASEAFQKIFLDLVGPIKNELENYSYILTIQCDLSKFVECYPLTTKEAAVVAKSFVDNFILRFGIPQEIVTDQGKEFMANVFQESCKLLGIKSLHSTAHHHETLGSLENSHKHLIAYLRIQTSNFPSNWSSWLPYWCFAYNNTVNTETKYTPYELTFGKSCNLPSNILHSIDPLYNFEDYAKEMKYRLQSAWNDARNNLLISKEKRKEKFDVKCNNICYNVGDKVLLLNENRSNKLESIYLGPYKVIEDSNPNLLLDIDNKRVLVHKNRVKFYYD